MLSLFVQKTDKYKGNTLNDPHSSTAATFLFSGELQQRMSHFVIDPLFLLSSYLYKPSDDWRCVCERERVPWLSVNGSSHFLYKAQKSISRSTQCWVGLNVNDQGSGRGIIWWKRRAANNNWIRIISSPASVFFFLFFVFFFFFFSLEICAK